MSLKPYHIELLRRLQAHQGGIPIADVDGRLLRRLRKQHLVATRAGLVRITPAGAQMVSGAADGAGTRPEVDVQARPLSTKQMDVLSRLHRHRTPVLADQIDGRVLRALRQRGLLSEQDGEVALNDRGRRAAEAARSGKVPGRRRVGPVNGRAQAIHRAVDELEAALPAGAEVEVGRMFASADDVVQGFRIFARQLQVTLGRRSADSPDQNDSDNP